MNVRKNAGQLTRLVAAGCLAFLVGCSGSSSTGVARYAANYEMAICDIDDPNDCQTALLKTNSDGLATIEGLDPLVGTPSGSVSENGSVDVRGVTADQTAIRFAGTITGEGAGRKVTDGVYYVTPQGLSEVPLSSWTAVCKDFC